MEMWANRLSGLAIALAGLLLLVFIIPHNTETVDYGWIRPQTIPNACAIALVIFGFAQLVLPTGSIFLRRFEVLRVGLFAAIAFCGVWVIGKVGFIAGAPVFAACLMLVVGERRPGWLLVGIVAVPAAIWIAVVPLLDRTLP